ncbi:hypothetical protein Efla_000108 [Eimeria flavescens]
MLQVVRLAQFKLPQWPQLQSPCRSELFTGTAADAPLPRPLGRGFPHRLHRVRFEKFTFMHAGSSHSQSPSLRGLCPGRGLPGGGGGGGPPRPPGGPPPLSVTPGLIEGGAPAAEEGGPGGGGGVTPPPAGTAAAAPATAGDIPEDPPANIVCIAAVYVRCWGVCGGRGDAGCREAADCPQTKWTRSAYKVDRWTTLTVGEISRDFLQLHRKKLEGQGSCLPLRNHEENLRAQQQQQQHQPKQQQLHQERGPHFLLHEGAKFGLEIGLEGPVLADGGPP